MPQSMSTATRPTVERLKINDISMYTLHIVIVSVNVISANFNHIYGAYNGHKKYKPICYQRRKKTRIQ